jgi:aldose 1-epimerase
MNVTSIPFGTGPGNVPVELYTLVNGELSASVCTYGGALARLLVPDRHGAAEDVVLGYETLDGYLADQCYFGALVGRVANRISRARFTLDGREYALDRNHGAHHLHGGGGGFHAKVWRAEPGEGADGPFLTLRCESPDGDQGYPGNVAVTAVYTLLADGLRLDLSATTDRPTVVGLTGHAYFNFSGRMDRDCLDHVLTIRGQRYLETDAELIPNGKLAGTAGTPLDFSTARAVGERIGEPSEPLAAGKGYDHCYVLDGHGFRSVATVEEPGSGRCMELYTDQPCLQFYSGNFIPDGLPGKGGTVYGWRSGLCLEPQGFVDAPNNPGFPSLTLVPGDEYRNTILYRFFTK